VAGHNPSQKWSVSNIHQSNAEEVFSSRDPSYPRTEGQIRPKYIYLAEIDVSRICPPKKNATWIGISSMSLELMDTSVHFYCCGSCQLRAKKRDNIPGDIYISHISALSLLYVWGLKGDGRRDMEAHTSCFTSRKV